VDVVAPSVSFTLLVDDELAYIFDLGDVSTGSLSISESRAAKPTIDCPRINIRDLSQTSLTALKGEVGSRTLSFRVYDVEEHELQVTFTWLKLLDRRLNPNENVKIRLFPDFQ